MSKFKVGDRVRIYERQYVTDGTIVGFDDKDLLRIRRDDAGISVNYFSPKQCRRLKPKAKKSTPDVVIENVEMKLSSRINVMFLQGTEVGALAKFDKLVGTLTFTVKK